jgi:hypothetical protein
MLGRKPRAQSRMSRPSCYAVGPVRCREAEAPAPLPPTGWHPGAYADMPDANVGEVNIPGLLVRIVGAAAGEGGQCRDD